jgi:hypothetical protein
MPELRIAARGFHHGDHSPLPTTPLTIGQTHPNSKQAHLSRARLSDCRYLLSARGDTKAGDKRLYRTVGLVNLTIWMMAALCRAKKGAQGTRRRLMGFMIFR